VRSRKTRKEAQIGIDFRIASAVHECGACFCVARPPPSIGEHRKGFLKELIEMRQSMKQRSRTPDDDQRSLKPDEKAIKILGNATSYGIFIELNLEDLDKSECLMCPVWGNEPWKVVSKNTKSSTVIFTRSLER
jgi:hypothetical protein